MVTSSPGTWAVASNSWAPRRRGTSSAGTASARMQRHRRPGQQRQRDHHPQRGQWEHDRRDAARGAERHLRQRHGHLGLERGHHEQHDPRQRHRDEPVRAPRLRQRRGRHRHLLERLREHDRRHDGSAPATSSPAMARGASYSTARARPATSSLATISVSTRPGSRSCGTTRRGSRSRAPRTTTRSAAPSSARGTSSPAMAAMAST